jgi:hypothetical protein
VGLLSVLLCIVALSAVKGVAADSEVPIERPTVVSISQTPSVSSGPCVPAPLGLTYAARNSPEAFTLRIFAASRPCTPIEAKAVVYAMPDGGAPWPQTLSQVVPFTISGAGITEVVFAKGCARAQFDVVTGETPQVILPLVAWHGPLLFPFDVSTSLQHGGDPSCAPPLRPTTTTTTASTSPLPPQGAAPAAPAAPQSAPTAAPEVAGTSTTPVAAPAAPVGQVANRRTNADPDVADVPGLAAEVSLDEGAAEAGADEPDDAPVISDAAGGRGARPQPVTGPVPRVAAYATVSSAQPTTSLSLVMVVAIAAALAVRPLLVQRPGTRSVPGSGNGEGRP